VPKKSALSLAPVATFEELKQIYGASVLPGESQEDYVERISTNLFMYQA
jgi:hypothetical protein